LYNAVRTLTTNHNKRYNTKLSITKMISHLTGIAPEDFGASYTREAQNIGDLCEGLVKLVINLGARPGAFERQTEWFRQLIPFPVESVTNKRGCVLRQGRQKTLPLQNKEYDKE
jgi:hypothetical protein